MIYEKNLKDVCCNIKRLRVARGYSVQELAYRCDIERSNLSRIEACRTNLTLRTMCKLAQALDVDVVELFSDGNI